MMILFSVFLLSLLVIIAVAIIRSENLFSAVMLSGIFSLLMASNFFVLDAADVALTEAAVGAGVATVLLLSALSLMPTRERPRVGRRRWIALVAVAVNVLVIAYATLDQPRLGDPQAPAHLHVAPWYLENTPVHIGVPNVVTSVLASYRGFDTLGEVFVVLIAGIGVLFLLSTGDRHLLPKNPEPRPYAGLRHHLIPQVIGKFLIPFIVLFGLYVQFHGEYGPGGGFQAGAIVSAGIILYALIEGERAALKVLPPRFLMGMAVGGALLYGGVGVLTMALGGAFLDYDRLAADPVLAQQIGIMTIELGVGLAVTGTLLSIFHAFAARG